MSDHRHQDRTELFTVVGAPYLPEQHADRPGHYHKSSDEDRRKGASASIAGLWLVFYGLVVGIAVLGKVGAGHAIDVAWSYFK